jgi:hypothetical protein
MAKSDRKIIDKVFVWLGVVATVVLIVVGAIAWYAYRFADNSVRTELSAQQIYFPAAGSAALDPKEFPDLQKYGGQLVDNGAKAKAYANGFIGRHLEKIAGGKTYSEVSALAAKDPTNPALQAQKATLFQGETLRGLLLGDGYAYWTFGQIAMWASLAAFAGAMVMGALVVLGWNHMKHVK